MKFEYKIDEIVKALTYNDLKGLLKLLDYRIFLNKELSISEMEVLLKQKLFQLEDKELFKTIELLMLSCARENSIGF